MWRVINSPVHSGEPDALSLSSNYASTTTHIMYERGAGGETVSRSYTV